MADLVNLNKARKQKAREAAQATAAQNRILFGRTRAEKAAESSAAEKARREIEGHKRDR
jgi:hypothetical protein